MKFIFFILASFSMAACAGSLSIEKPLNDNIYMYGLGIHTSHSTAEKLAMANLTQEIFSKVDSETTSEENLNNGVQDSRLKVKVTVSTLAINLTGVRTLKSVQIEGEWNILVRANRSSVQLAINNQLENISDDFSLLLDDHSETPGPACWVALKESENDKPKFRSLVSAYIGSGVRLSKTKVYSDQIKAFEKLFKKCIKRNRYRLLVENDLNGMLKQSLQESLSSSEIKLTRSNKNTGIIEAKLESQYKAAFNQEIIYLSVKLKVKDEFGNFIKETKIKTKGVSFSSRKDAEKQAIRSLINKIRKLSFTI